MADMESSALNGEEDDDEFEGFGSDDGGADLDVVGDVDQAFGLDSEDEDSDAEVDSENEDEDAEAEADAEAAEEQLQGELLDDAVVSSIGDRKPTKKKRQKT